MSAITEPGIYTDLDNETYHAQTQWMSSTNLKRLVPEHYKTGGSQDALDFGTLFHTCVLEPDDLARYTVLDADKVAGNNPKTGKPYAAPEMTAKFKAAVADAEAKGETVVAQADWDRAHAMRDAVLAHPKASALLLNGPGAYEESAFWESPDGLLHKARFDRRVPGAIVDLKSTTAKPSEDALTRAVLDYGYDLSAAHYLAVAQGLDLDVEVFALVFVAKEAPHYVTVAQLSDAFLDRGHALRALAIERATNPTAPRYEGAHNSLTLSPPPWATKGLVA